MNTKFSFLCALFSLVCAGINAQNIKSVQTQEYEWSSVPIVGGGFVDGFICHPHFRGVRYCRTDMGGAYRWNDESKEWEPLLDWVSDAESNLQGIESIALDPENPKKVYLACGTYTNKTGSILRSSDGGKSFERTDVPIPMGGNENGRGNGERMMVDPANPDIIYFGTRQSGLWRSEDGAVTWQKVATFPDVDEHLDPTDRRSYFMRGSGIIAVVFDSGNIKKNNKKSLSAKSKTKTIYAAASLQNRESIFVSTNGGDSWQAVKGQPTKLRPTHMILASDGNLYITYADTPGPSQMSDGYVWKYNTKKGTWQDISPVKTGKNDKSGFGYAAVSVAPSNPKHVIVSTHCLEGKHGYDSDEIFRSTDGGKNWIAMFKHGYEYDHSLAPYTKMAPLHWMFDIEIDPFDSNHAMFTTGFGGWETFNLSDAGKNGKNIRWSIVSKGIEETVPLEFYTPPTGAHLLSGVGDYGGYTHFDLTKPVPEGAHFEPYFGNTDAVTGAWHKPELMLRAGVIFNHLRDVPPVSYSEDGGRTWNYCASVPEKGSEHGHVAMSAMGNVWIWTPERKAAHFSTDKGTTWTKCEGVPEGIKIIADKENDNLFYAVDVRKETLYVSNDGGKKFRALPMKLNLKVKGEKQERREDRGDVRGGQDRVYAIPSIQGGLWLAAYDGLYRCNANINNVECVQMREVENIIGFGLGAAKNENSHPSLYLIGTIAGQYGFFRSDDDACSWTKINDANHQYGKVLHIIGDMQEYGRVYIGTHGRGIVTGAPKAK